MIFLMVFVQYGLVPTRLLRCELNANEFLFMHFVEPVSYPDILLKKVSYLGVLQSNMWNHKQFQKCKPLYKNNWGMK